MAKNFRFEFIDEDYEGADRQTASLAGLAVTLLIVVMCLFVMHQLHRTGVIDNCLLSGRTNCVVLIPNAH